MTTHKTSAGGQLLPLDQRLSIHQQQKREARIMGRKTNAQRLSTEHAILTGTLNSVLALLRRGFFGRLKWLVLGR
jgi:hypothetical protein